MTTPTQNDINFYLPGSTTPYEFLNGYIYDERYYLDIQLNCTNSSKFLTAQVFISKENANVVPDSYELIIGDNYIVNPIDATDGDIRYENPDGSGKFEDNTRYTIRVKATLLDENNLPVYCYANFGVSSTFSFLYRYEGGDFFSSDPTDYAVMNENLIEGAAGSGAMPTRSCSCTAREPPRLALSLSTPIT